MKKNYVKEYYKTKGEWLEHRGIGGSSAAAIVNKSKWLSKVDVYNELALNKPTTIAENERMIEGTIAEGHIRSLFTLEHPEFEVLSPPKKRFWLFRRKDYPLLTLTPDGILKEKATGYLYGWECKDVELRKKEVRENWENGILPEQYYCQCLHYLVVRNDLRGVCLTARLKYFTYDYGLSKWVFDHAEERNYWVFRDDVGNEIQWLENNEIDFIENNINKKRKPATIIQF